MNQHLKPYELIRQSAPHYIPSRRFRQIGGASKANSVKALKAALSDYPGFLHPAFFEFYDENHKPTFAAVHAALADAQAIVRADDRSRMIDLGFYPRSNAECGGSPLMPEAWRKVPYGPTLAWLDVPHLRRIGMLVRGSDANRPVSVTLFNLRALDGGEFLAPLLQAEIYYAPPEDNPDGPSEPVMVADPNVTDREGLWTMLNGTLWMLAHYRLQGTRRSGGALKAKPRQS